MTLGGVILLVVAAPFVLLFLYGESLKADDPGPRLAHIRSLPCTTWATGTTTGGGYRTADVQVGLADDCSDEEIVDVYEKVNREFDRSLATRLDLYVAMSEPRSFPGSNAPDMDGTLDRDLYDADASEHDLFDSRTGELVARFGTETTARASDDLRQAVADWICIREIVDSSVALEFDEPFDGDGAPAETIELSVPLSRLATSSPLLPARLRVPAPEITFETRARQ